MSALSQDPHFFASELSRLAEKSARLVGKFLQHQTQQPHPHGFDPLNIGGAFLNMTRHMVSDPTYLPMMQAQFWHEWLGLCNQVTQKMLGAQHVHKTIQADAHDKRFKDPAWHESQIFDFIKQSYLLTARWTQSLVHDVDGLDDATRRKVDFYTRQFVDAVSPSNFALTNPAVIRATLESGGENLLKGLENLLDDLERGGGKLKIRMTDETAFRVGGNLAITPGSVMYRNDLVEVIQYDPATETVRKRPIYIMPPWINKYYILDLRPQNSLVKWLVENGHTVFIASWVNPDSTLAQKDFSCYLREGLFDVLEILAERTDSPQIDCAGYCLGGTLLACGMAYEANLPAEKRRIATGTFLTTLLDFTDVGDISVFVDPDQITALETMMQEKGVLDADSLHTTFNLLRANDLIWSFMINNYLLGKDAFPFDLLYWNGDSTNMPAAMHGFYLKNLYRDNLLAKPDGLELLGKKLDLGKITAPALFLATSDDHIAPWQSVYRGMQLYGGSKTFILGGSGHTNGVVNPPASGKYSWQSAPTLPPTAAEWQKNATMHPGSWWPAWHDFLMSHSAEMTPARPVQNPIYPAPGEYVHIRVR